jgi:hypothetical protein
MPRPLAVALKHSVSPSPVHVEMREERAAGGACSLRLLCSLTTIAETHQIGWPGPVVDEEECTGPTDYEISLDGVDLRSHEYDVCRAAFHQLLAKMDIPGPLSLLDPAAGEWYEPVIRAASEGIVVRQQQAVTSGEETRGYAVVVSLSIEETFSFVQPEALLLACEQAAIPGSRTPPDERCAVCMECLPLPAPRDGRPAVCTDEQKAFTLPSCGHRFHRGCIAAWFRKGSTCPLCRCDMMYCLFDLEKQFGLEREKETVTTTEPTATPRLTAITTESTNPSTAVPFFDPGRPRRQRRPSTRLDPRIWNLKYK